MSKISSLGDIVSFIGGGTPDRKKEEYWDGEIPWATVKDFNSGNLLKKPQESITQIGLKSSAANLIKAGTLVIPTRMALGKAAIASVDMAINQDLKAVIPNTNIDTRYLLWYFIANSKKINEMGKGATVKGVTLDQLRQLKINVPTLEKQRRIAAILDKAEALRAKRREAIARLDRLLQSVFLEMFGDPVSNSKKWPQILLKDIGEITTGNTPSKDVDEYYGNNIDWIKSDNLNHRGDYITDADIKLSELGAKKGRIVPKGSILVTCIAGSFDCIGNLAMTDKKVAFNQQINSVTPFKSPSEYVYSLLRYSKPLIQAASTNSMKGMISKGKFSEISFIDTDMNLQIEFSIIFNKFQSIKKKFERSLDSIENLISSLQKKYFN